MGHVNNKFFRKDEDDGIIIKSAGWLKPVSVRIPPLRPSLDTGYIKDITSKLKQPANITKEVDILLDYPDGSSLSFFPIANTIIKHRTDIQKGKWIYSGKAACGNNDEHWGGYGLSYVHIGISKLVFDWFIDDLIDHVSSEWCKFKMNEGECIKKFKEDSWIYRDESHVWIEAKVKDKIKGWTKKDDIYHSSVTHSMLLNKNNTKGKASIKASLVQIYNYNYGSPEWDLQFSIDRMEDFEFVELDLDWSSENSYDSEDSYDSDSSYDSSNY